jgi:2-haloacid dehalogenase
MDVLVFDVNETLLDLQPLDAHFAGIFGDAGKRKEWFAQLLQLAFTATLTGVYRDFTGLARSALHMTAAKAGAVAGEEQVDALLKEMTQLPPHADVPDALQTLHEAGFRMATLTQSAPETHDAQMRNANLAKYFERLLSVDECKRYKPDPAPYHMAASAMGCNPPAMRMIAAHGWDLQGAMAAGCKAAFVARSGSTLDPAADPPEIGGADLGEVAVEILGQAGAIKA